MKEQRYYVSKYPVSSYTIDFGYFIVSDGERNGVVRQVARGENMRVTVTRENSSSRRIVQK